MMAGDPLRRVLYIDLSRRRFKVEERPELFEETLGGVAAGIRLLTEECPTGADPLGPENPIVFAVGPLAGFYPMASKTVALFKSPHTGNLGESHAGGRSALALRMAGYGAVVIQGASPTPVYLAIDSSGAHFRDAAGIWGMRNAYEVGSVLREREGSAGVRSIMRIGRAGERMLTYACVITETYRHFGRLGLGAVFGSKKLKGIITWGRRSLEPADRKAFVKAYDEVFEAATRSSLMKKYHDLGTPMNVLPMNELGALPTRNLRSGRFEGAHEISGETFAEKYLGRRVACAHCPVACVHLAALRVPHPKEPYFYKTSMLGYDYEPIFSLGSLLGVSDVPGLLQLMDEVEIQGLDCMSAGVVLAWATEALDKGLISTRETDGLDLAWGNWQAYVEATRRIAGRTNDFYRALGRGVDHAASLYGGEDFALSFGGNEMSGYHVGPATHVGHLVGARHSHLDGGGYSVDQKLLSEGKSPTPEGVASALLEDERWKQLLSSLVVCFFARGVYTPDVTTRVLATVGWTVTRDDLNRIAADALRRKQAFKAREGFDATKLRIPGRILETPTPLGVLDEAFLRKAIDAFVAASAAE
jgi:aldehyde:ferredoxin oxidoreductase